MSRSCDRRRRSRWSAATVARDRTVSRSEGKPNSMPASCLRGLGVQVHEADGLLAGPAVRPGDAGHGHPDVDSEPRPYAGGHLRGRFGRHGAVLGQRGRRHPELPHFHRVRVGDDCALEDGARARDGRQPRRHEAAGTRLGRPQRPATGAAEIEHERFHGALVACEQILRQGLCERLLERLGTLLRARPEEQVDVDLELTSADGRLHPVPVAPGVGERLRDRRLARAVEAEHPPPGRLRAGQHAPHRLGLQRAGPEPLELRGRSGQDDGSAGARVENDPRRRSRQSERDRPGRQGRLLAHARLEVGVRPVEPLRDLPRDAADLGVQRLVDHERRAPPPSRSARPCGRRASGRAHPRRGRARLRAPRKERPRARRDGRRRW